MDHCSFRSLRTLMVLLGMLVISGSVAQPFPSEMWHEGKAVLAEGDTLKGMIKYDFSQDIIQFTHYDQRVEAFSARKILFFEIYDNSVRRYRQFFTLPFTQTGSYRAPIFFELLTDGKLTVLCRESLEYRSVSYGYYGGSYQRLTLVNRYYFLEEKGDIVLFEGDKRDLLDKMGKYAEDVEDYMKANRLHMDEKYDFVKIVAYYNSFFQK
jgi:hypothetical protein